MAENKRHKEPHPGNVQSFPHRVESNVVQDYMNIDGYIDYMLLNFHESSEPTKSPSGSKFPTTSKRGMPTRPF